MLALVSPLRGTRDGEILECFNSMGASYDEFADLSDANLLESVNFDNLFAGINVLPDLEMDGGDMFAKFSGGTCAEELSVENCSGKGDSESQEHDVTVTEKEESVSGSGHTSSCDSGTSRADPKIVSEREESGAVANPSTKEGGKGRKSSSKSKSNPQGKRKVKVDWTPELHRGFVQAVEQLGLEKAVPSRILEIMGIQSLTRQNIASHLQKYRSHRKHVLAREAEAASWTQRRQRMYGAKGAPAMGFPPPIPMHHFRPLYVWGHPSSMPLPPPPPVPPLWAPPSNPSFWHAQHQGAPNALTSGGTPCFPQPPPTTTRFGCPLVPGIPPHAHAMYKADPGIGVPTRPRPLLDFHPSKESIDAAIGDVISKPWLPLPLGLKPPDLDTVLCELKRQGIPNIPPPS